MAKQQECPVCEGKGYIEYYPPYGANAFDGCGNAISLEAICTLCKGKGRVRHKYRQVKRMIRNYWM